MHSLFSLFIAVKRYEKTYTKKIYMKIMLEN